MSRKIKKGETYIIGDFEMLGNNSHVLHKPTHTAETAPFFALVDKPV